MSYKEDCMLVDSIMLEGCDKLKKQCVVGMGNKLGRRYYQHS